MAVTPALIGAGAAARGQAVFLGIACGAKIAASVDKERPKVLGIICRQVH